MGTAAIIATIIQVAAFTKVPPQLLIGICFTESSLRPLGAHVDVTSQAYGVCQMHLETAQWVDKVYKHRLPVTGEKLLIPYVNAFYAGKYLKLLLSRYKGDWAKAATAYNKGHADTGNSAYWHRVESNIRRSP